MNHIPVQSHPLSVSQIWMLTGDKLETATCIAKSSKLVSRTQTIHTFRKITNRSDAHLELNAFRRKNDCALVITGESLQVCVSQSQGVTADICFVQMGSLQICTEVSLQFCVSGLSLQECVLFQGIQIGVYQGCHCIYLLSRW